MLNGVRAHVTLTAGTWPGPRRTGAPLGVALPVTTAGLLHYSVGQVLSLRDSLTGGPVRLRVTGLFRPRDPAAPYWRLSLLGIAGKFVQGTFITYGPMLVDPSALAPGGLPVSAASWLITIDTAPIPPGGITRLGNRVSAAVSRWQGNQRRGGLTVTTGLPQTLSALASGVVGARSILLIDSLLVLVLAAAAAALAARLLASQREEETALLSARGVARAQLARTSLAEALLLAVTGCAAGIVLGGYLADLLLSASGLPGARARGLPGTVAQVVSDGAWWPGAVIAVLVVVMMTWPALHPVTPGAARQHRGRATKLATAAGAGLDAALIALGLLALWELRRYSAISRLSGNRFGIDPVLAVAPALALAGIALVPLRALPAAARLLDHLSARGRRLAGALASWQVSRRPVRESSPVLLVVLAVATGTVALAQHQSWRQSQLDQAAFATGADVRAGLATALPLDHGNAVVRAPGVLAAMPVSTFYNGFDVFALDAATAARTVLLRPDLSSLPLTTLWKRITPERAGPGLLLPGRPARLGVRAMLRAPRGGHLGAMSASLSVQDGWGIVYSVPAGNLPADGRYHRLVADLAASGQPGYRLRLLGISLSYRLPGFPAPPFRSLAAKLAAAQAEGRIAAARATLAIRGLAVSSRAQAAPGAPFARAAAVIGWHAAAGSADLANPLAHGIRPTVASWQVRAGAAALTFTAGAGHLIQISGLPPLPVSGQLAFTAGPPRLPIPAVATQAFFAAGRAHVGQVVLVPVGNISVPVRLAAEIRAFPTTGRTQPAVIIDQAWLQEALAAQSQPPLPVTQWWLATALGAAPGLPAHATVSTRARSAGRLLGDPLPNVPQLSLLVIALAAGLLAGLGFVVSVVASLRERHLQDALLAALGVGRVARAAQLGLEQLMLSLPGAAAGVVIGVALAHVLVPAVTLATGASVAFPPAHVVVPLGWTALLALGIVAAPVLVAAAAAARRPDPAAQLRAGEAG